MGRGFPCREQVSFLLLLSKISLSDICQFDYNTLVWIYLMYYLVFFEILGSGCPFSSPDLEIFQLLFLWISFLVLSLPPPSENPPVYILICMMVPYKSLILHFFHSFSFIFLIEYFQFPIFEISIFFFLLDLL